MNVFTAVANTAEIAAETQEPNIVLTVLLIAAGVAALCGWGYVANNAWVEWSTKKTEDNRAEMIIAAAAPITVPALAVLAGTKWFIARTRKTA
jgi:hypothetical protein